MHHFGSFLLFILISGCTATKKDAIDGKKTAVITIDSKDFKDSQDVPETTVPIVAPPLLGPVVVPEALPLPAPIYSRGGGGGHNRLLCENGLSDCNDHNPCTIDTCKDDTCIHKLDESKDQFGSCEVDGHSCTVGKCIEDEGRIQCLEQRREYIAGELGCQDDNQCTTDSCIEIPGGKEPHTTKDGDVIPNNEYQCVYEISSGLLCETSDCFSGFCEQVGTGMNPSDPFMVACVVPEGAKLNCPATGNPCTTNICVAGGCAEENVPVETPCDDNDRCTENKLCDGDGACLGTPIDPAVLCGASPQKCRAFACDSSLGCVLTAAANEGQACSSGDPCLDGETCTEGVCGSGSEVLCPTDGNACTSDICQSGLGCIYEPVGGSCSDNNNCTTNDSCVNGQCLGEDRDCATDPTNPCQMGFCDMSNEEGCTTINFTGLYGADCTTTYPGACVAGKELCVEGDLASPAVCEPLIRPGDEAPACFNPAKDNDCDGSPDNACDCPVPPSATTYRYVDPAGSDTTNCSNASSPCRTIAYAISVASGQDTLLLAAGTFTGTDITVDKDLYIYGQGAGVSIVDAQRNSGVFFVRSLVSASFCGLTITNGDAGDGGGIGGRAGNLTVTSCTISGNTASDGGGINSYGNLTIINSTISGNNGYDNGGGVYSRNGGLNITNSTISGNSSDNGGGIYTTSNTTINNSTITNNSSLNGAGLNRAGGTTTINHTIIAVQSSGSDCVGGGVTSGTFNLGKDGTCNGGGFTQVPTFTLPPLANNGGPTQTHALILGGAGTQAIDASGDCGVDIDQRGYPRTPSANNCDIGAFEVQP